MSDNFEYQCKRRSIRRRSVGGELLGAGSGGDDGDGNVFHTDDGDWIVSSAQVHILGQGSEGGFAASPVVSILAAPGAVGGPDGRVEAHGTQGVRISSGPFMKPPAANETINGVEIAVGDAQSINIVRGFTEPAVQTIQMAPGMIVVDGGPGSITLLSKTSIFISVAGGTSSISLTPKGITIQGLLTQVNP